ncbi:unnamed protein product [Prunus armeniaca]
MNPIKKRDIKEAMMRADQLELECTNLKKEMATSILQKQTAGLERCRVQALAEDLVKRFAQMNSKTMTLSEGD